MVTHVNNTYYIMCDIKDVISVNLGSICVFLLVLSLFEVVLGGLFAEIIYDCTTCTG